MRCLFDHYWSEGPGCSWYLDASRYGRSRKIDLELAFVAPTVLRASRRGFAIDVRASSDKEDQLIVAVLHNCWLSQTCRGLQSEWYEDWSAL